ncbi:TrmH family RNA methyltransferase [Corynebacterium ulceribovis]|uniref:TrmH family RNA methyltransferase n=1 Tax=Corynebacterium ulceribovis TaxID=487732 RepID=UPI0003630E4C|nr:RNA methyltransferase [Corynebacterium ulceribovis]
MSFVPQEAVFTERTPRIVAAGKLHRAAQRRKVGLFLTEGFNSVEAALQTGIAQEVFVTESARERFFSLLDATTTDVSVIDDRAAKTLADTVTSTGLFAVCRSNLVSYTAAISSASEKTPLVAVPVETAEPGNAGTVIRVADAVGAGAVVFAGETVDPLSGKVVRASAGSSFHIPVAREANILAVIEELREQDFQILATAADGEIDLAEAANAGADGVLGQPTAWLFGNEAHGLPQELQNEADLRVRIPIRGRAESLNLATAASICLWESAKALG